MLEYDPFNWFWIVGGDESQYYSSAAQDYVTELPEGVVPTRIASFDELVEVLRAAGVSPYHKVNTYVIVRRLEDAGLLGAAQAGLESSLSDYWRFTTANGRGGINADDAESRAFLTGIGADPDAILAPE